MARSGKNISFGADSAHTVSEEEKAGFVDYINTLLREDAELQEQHLVPLEPNSDQIFSAVESGLLLAKLVNAVAPNAVDMKKINKKSTLSTFNKTANLNVVLAAAKEIGVQVTNVGAEDIMEGRPHLVLGIIWQVLRVGLETQMRRNIEALGLSGFKNLRSAQEILLKWVNDSIAAQGCKRTARNLSSDISDSEVYAFLLKSIDPSVDTAAILAAADHGARADAVLKAAERLGLKRFVQPADIVSGSQRLNFAFVANLFNNAKHAKPAAAESPAQPNREAELLAIIERLQIENEALKRDNERLRQGSEEGSKLKKRVVELESNAQSANLAAELDQLKLQLAEAEQARAKLAEQSAASASAGQLAQELQSKLAAQEEANRQLHQELQAKESSLQKLKAEEEAELAKLKSELNAQEDKLKAQMKEKEEEMERLRAQMNKTEAASAEQRNLEEQLRSAELALQDYEDRLKAIAAEDFVQKKALEEKQDNLMNLPLSAIRNGKERFSGWLHKAGNRNKAQWKKRYCVLRDNYLFYYHTDNDKKEKQGKWVRLNGAKVESLGDREKDKKRHLFVIHPQQEAAQGEKAEKEPKEKADKAKPKAPQYYEFFGADEAEMNQWVNALNAQIAALGPTTNEQMLRQSLYRRQTIAKDKSPVADAPAPEGAAKLEPINADAPREVPAAAAPAAAAPAAPAAEAPLSPATAEKKKDVGVLSKITSKFFSDDKKEKKESHKDEKEKEKEAHPAATDEKKAEGDAAAKDAEPKKEADAKEHKEGEAKKDKKEKKDKKHKEKKDDSSKSDSKEEKKEKEAHKEGEAKKDDKHEKKDGGVMGKITAIFTGDEKKDKDAHKEAHPAASPSTEEAKEKEPKEEKKDEHKEKEHKEKEHKEKEHKEKEHKEEKKDGGVMGKITAIFTGDEKKDKDAHKESPHPAAAPAAGEEHKEEKKESSSGSAEASKEQAPASPKSEPREAHGKDDKEHEERKRKEKEEKEAKKAAEKEREAKEKAEKKAKKEQEKREHDAKKEAERKEHEERKAKEKEEKEAKKAAEAREREEKKAAEKARKSDGKGDAAAAPVGSPALPKEEEAKKEEAKPADEAPKAAEEGKAAEAPKAEEAKKDDGAKAELAV